jgi:hypothetical protein
MTRRSPDELVTVASAQNQADAGFVQNLLRDAGVPFILRRSAGADVPDFLAAGRREVTRLRRPCGARRPNSVASTPSSDNAGTAL